MREQLKWYDDKADNSPWINVLRRSVTVSAELLLTRMQSKIDGPRLDLERVARN